MHIYNTLLCRESDGGEREREGEIGRERGRDARTEKELAY